MFNPYEKEITRQRLRRWLGWLALFGLFFGTVLSLSGLLQLGMVCGLVWFVTSPHLFSILLGVWWLNQ